jgi:disulfide bond formation protein DsbB
MSRRIQILFAIVFGQALLAFLGSLYFSNILLYAPCDLCWYQRIAMYPLGVISLVALARKDVNGVWYALPLSIIGLLIAVWHVTKYTLVNVTQSVADVPCSIDGTSCTTRYLDIFGFISIPHLSLVAFIITTVALFMIANEARRK